MARTRGPSRGGASLSAGARRRGRPARRSLACVALFFRPPFGTGRRGPCSGAGRPVAARPPPGCVSPEWRISRAAGSGAAPAEEQKRRRRMESASRRRRLLSTCPPGEGGGSCPGRSLILSVCWLCVSAAGARAASRLAPSAGADASLLGARQRALLFFAAMHTSVVVYHWPSPKTQRSLALLVCST
ncbi:unnamed protein product, partial [Amoebophrya sp. A120]|eukprot:GSA120T00007648001.1